MLKASLLSVIAFAFAAQNAIAQDDPLFYRTNCIKLLPGKTTEDYRQYIATTKRLWQSAADDGEIASWGVLRAVIPAGEAARCDFVSVTTFPAAPPPPLTADAVNARMKKIGMNGTAAQLYAKRDSITKLISGEMWRSTIRVGEVQKGDYMYVNYMKVRNMTDFLELEKTMWKPLAEHWVKNGAMRGWRQSVAFLPGGTEVPYRAMTADVFPSWEAVFKPLQTNDTFKTVHAGKNLDEFFGKLNKSRDLAKRELYVVEERVVAAKQISQK